jgi:hypothetical protein
MFQPKPENKRRMRVALLCILDAFLVGRENENDDRVRLLAHIELIFATYVARYTEARQAGLGHKKTIGLAIRFQTEGIEKAKLTGNGGLMTEFMSYVRDFIPVLLDALDGRPAS